MPTIVYIGLGSNLAEPQLQILKAFEALKNIPNSHLIACSSLYASKPMGPQDQPDYVNAVAKLSTALSAKSLLEQLQSIELNSGRVRKENRWGARILDLDILLFGQEIIDSDNLVVPHYGMKTREFVVYPLAEIEPALVLPDGTKIIELRQSLPQNNMAIINNN